MSLSSFNKIVIDPSALEHNYRLIFNTAAERVKVLAMVKSDAYGHGLAAASAAFASTGCKLFGVAEMAEGVDLREYGCQGEIIIFLGFDESHIDYFFSHNLTPVLFTKDDLFLISSAAERKKEKIAIFLKFDCGMSRLGFKPSETKELSRWLKKQPYLDLKGIMSHFPCADDRLSGNTPVVYREFSQTVEAFSKNGRVMGSICNSGGVLYFPETHGDMVRSGIALYGYYPDGTGGRPDKTEQGLKPAMTFSTRILQINEVPAGTGISYGHTCTAEHDMKLAVLPVGYSDGYPRNLSNRAEVLIHGKRAAIRGRICMNLCMVDISRIEGVKSGDEAVLLGSQGKETIDADEIGSWSNTISYEILCSLGNNNKRVTK